MSRIILIDDQPIANFITRKLLEIEGFDDRVEDYTDARQALQNLNSGEFCLIFLDLNMPDMNGWEFLDALEHITQNAKVIVLTSSTSRIDKQKAETYLAVIEFIEKPLNKAKLTSLTALQNL
jgi:CheY-like chemotaxis protein